MSERWVFSVIKNPVDNWKCNRIDSPLPLICIYLLLQRMGFTFIHQRDIELRLLKPMGPASLKAIKSDFLSCHVKPFACCSSLYSWSQPLFVPSQHWWCCWSKVASKNPDLSFVKAGSGGGVIWCLPWRRTAWCLRIFIPLMGFTPAYLLLQFKTLWS